MMYIPKIADYLKIYKRKLYSILKKNRKVAKSLYMFLATPDEVGKYTKMMQSNSTDNCVHRYNIMILNLFNPELQLIKLI